MNGVREPLTPHTAFLAIAEAREHEMLPGAFAHDRMAERRRGRVEAEGFRISEEMTQRAQERLATERAVANAESPSSIPAEDNARSAGNGIQPAAAGQTMASSASLHQAHALKLEPLVVSRVIAPLDGSVSSERALPYAALVARLTGATLLLTHVVTPPLSLPVKTLASLDDHLEGVPDAERAPSAPTFDPTTYLADIQGRVSLPRSSVDVLKSETVLSGLNALLAASKDALVVVAPHHRSLIGRWAYGQVVDGLIQHAGQPILLVPWQSVQRDVVPASNDAPESSTPLATFRRILVAVDGSALAERAIEPLMGILTAVSGAVEDADAPRVITVLCVANTFVALTDAEAYVKALGEALRAIPLSYTVGWTSAALVGSAPGVITAATAHGLPRQSLVMGSAPVDEPYDLVVMATHGKGGLSHLLYGSVASYVLAHTQAPVLLTHSV